MAIPEWLKPGIFGAVVGGIAVAVVGFSWGGWVTGGGASKMANALAHDKVISAMVPLCLDMSTTDPDRRAKLATIKDASSYNRRDAVMAAGWATFPGSKSPNRDLAQACIPGLKLDS